MTRREAFKGLSFGLLGGLLGLGKEEPATAEVPNQPFPITFEVPKVGQGHEAPLRAYPQCIVGGGHSIWGTGEGKIAQSPPMVAYRLARRADGVAILEEVSK